MLVPKRIISTKRSGVILPMKYGRGWPACRGMETRSLSDLRSSDLSPAETLSCSKPFCNCLKVSLPHCPAAAGRYPSRGIPTMSAWRKVAVIEPTGICHRRARRLSLTIFLVAHNLIQARYPYQVMPIPGPLPIMRQRWGEHKTAALKLL